MANLTEEKYQKSGKKYGVVCCPSRSTFVASLLKNNLVQFRVKEKRLYQTRTSTRGKCKCCDPTLRGWWVVRIGCNFDRRCQEARQRRTIPSRGGHFLSERRRGSLHPNPERHDTISSTSNLLSHADGNNTFTSMDAL